MADQLGNGKAGKKGPSGRSYRNATGLTRQPKKMRGRKVSSQRWLTRQLNDPFVAEAKSRGFRSRAALKLEQMDDRYHLLQPGMAIVDLGCAPGGWLQVSSIRTKLGHSKARLIGIDLLDTEGDVGADIFTGDMTDPEMLEKNLMFGSPKTVIDKIKIYENLGVNEFIYYASMGLSHEAQKRSLRLFCEEVIPEFQ